MRIKSEFQSANGARFLSPSLAGCFFVLYLQKSKVNSIEKFNSYSTLQKNPKNSKLKKLNLKKDREPKPPKLEKFKNQFLEKKQKSINATKKN
jgi:hypothetical protein